jgi:hypothetical protein
MRLLIKNIYVLRIPDREPELGSGLRARRVYKLIKAGFPGYRACTGFVVGHGFNNLFKSLAFSAFAGKFDI